MKALTITLATLSLFGLAACNTQEAANNTADNAATDNALLPLDNAVDANAASDAKPVDGAGNEAAAPAGDKPADNATEAAATDAPPAGDKPTE